MTDLEEMQLAYLEALYFTDTGDVDQPSSDAEITPLCRAIALNDCANFHMAITREVENLIPDLNWSRVGHDFWLTRNGHGTGFWDHPEVYGHAGSKWLTAMATACGEHDAEFEGELESVIDNALRQVQTLRDEGFAVVIFHPDDLSGADPRRIEGRLVELGTEAVDAHALAQNLNSLEKEGRP